MLSINPDTLAKIAANELCIHILLPLKGSNYVVVLEDKEGVRITEEIGTEICTIERTEDIFSRMLLAYKRIGV